MGANSNLNDRDQQGGHRMIHLFWASLLVIVLAIVGYVTYSKVKNVNADIKNLNSQISKLSAQIENADTATQPKENNDNNNEAQEQIQADVKSLSSELDRVKRTIRDRIAAISNGDGDYKNNLESINQQIGNLKREVNRVSRMGSQLQKQDADSSAYSSLDERLGQHNQKLIQIESSMLAAIDGITQIHDLLNQLVMLKQPTTNQVSDLKSAEIEP